MPKLLLFVPCEKPLVGADNLLSLINVIHSITVSPSTDDLDDSAKAAAKTEWHVVTVWQQELGDEGLRFQQRVTMTDPGGTLLLQLLTEFEMPKPYHRNFGKIPGFPVSMIEGEYTLSVSLQNMKDKKWIEKGTYPLRINIRRTREPKPSPSASKSQTH